VQHDTIGVLGIDASGALAGCCTTSGRPWKLPGRVGDSPIIGHGLYVHPEHGAAVCTGHGELVMGVCGAFSAVEAMRNGATPREAARLVMDRLRESYPLVESDQVGIITLNPSGAWSAAALRAGFRVAVRCRGRDEMVNPEFIAF
jgi:N4-(beta-N-acetylglucosaminyl)-L-asparaginase